MTRPTVHATTEAVYAALPEFYRDADAATVGGSGYPLLRYLSLIVDQAGAIADLLDRIDYVPVDDPDYDPALNLGDTSDLVDPALADAAWLPWQAQLVGITLNLNLDEAARRATITGASAGWQVGTNAAIVTAAQTVLTGTKSARVVALGPFALEVVTIADETASGAAVIAAIESGGARPAGVVITQSAYSATWTTVETVYPTWADLELLAPTWGQIEATP